MQILQHFFYFVWSNPKNNHIFMSFYLLHILWIYNKKRALEHSQLFPTFHHVLHSTFSIGFTSLCLLVQTLHRCFLNEPSVLLSFLQGLNYTIEREKKISFTHSQQCCLSPSLSLSMFLSFFCTNSFHETQTYSCWATQSPSLSCGLMGKIVTTAIGSSPCDLELTVIVNGIYHHRLLSGATHSDGRPVLSSCCCCCCCYSDVYVC